MCLPCNLDNHLDLKNNNIILTPTPIFLVGEIIQTWGIVLVHNSSSKNNNNNHSNDNKFNLPPTNTKLLFSDNNNNNNNSQRSLTRIPTIRLNHLLTSPIANSPWLGPLFLLLIPLVLIHPPSFSTLCCSSPSSHFNPLILHLLLLLTSPLYLGILVT